MKGSQKVWIYGGLVVAGVAIWWWMTRTKSVYQKAYDSLIRSVNIIYISDDELKKAIAQNKVSMTAASKTADKEGYLGYYPHSLHSRMRIWHPSFWSGSGYVVRVRPRSMIGSRRHFWRRNGSMYYYLW